MGLPRAAPGKPITSGLWNALVDAVEELRGRKPDGRVSGSTGGGQEHDFALPASISAVHGTPDSNGRILAGVLTYDYVMRDTLATGTARVPEMGRPFDITPEIGAVLRIKPAAVGDRCWIVRTRLPGGGLGPAKLWVTTEKLSMAVCSAAPPPGGPAGIRERELQRMQVGRVGVGGGANAGGGSPSGGVGA